MKIILKSQNISLDFHVVNTDLDLFLRSCNAVNWAYVCIVETKENETAEELDNKRAVLNQMVSLMPGCHVFDGAAMEDGKIISEGLFVIGLRKEAALKFGRMLGQPHIVTGSLSQLPKKTMCFE